MNNIRKTGTGIGSALDNIMGGTKKAASTVADGTKAIADVTKAGVKNITDELNILEATLKKSKNL